MNNVATLADDAVLTLPVEANAVYRFNALIDYSAATTADFLYGFTGPSGSTARFRGESMASNASATTSPADNGGKGLNTGITAGALGVGARALMAPSGCYPVRAVLDGDHQGRLGDPIAPPVPERSSGGAIFRHSRREDVRVKASRSMPETNGGTAKR